MKSILLQLTNVSGKVHVTLNIIEQKQDIVQKTSQVLPILTMTITFIRDNESIFRYLEHSSISCHTWHFRPPFIYSIIGL